LWVKAERKSIVETFASLTTTYAAVFTAAAGTEVRGERIEA
jgi:hypothetical protein